MKYNPNRMAMASLLIAGSLSVAQTLCAQTPAFTYTNRDLMLCFRKTGQDGTGTTSPNDLEINIGQASIYYGATPGAVIPVTAYNAAQIGIFDSLDDLSWSVGGCVPVGDTGDASIPLKTLWATAPRITSPTTPATPWVRNSATFQGFTSAKMNTILAQAAFYSGTVPANSVSNAAKVVIVPVGSDHEYGYTMGQEGNYGGAFQGDVENTTSPTFTTDGVPARSDFYALLPDTTGTQPAGTYLGYFEFEPNGTMNFVAAGGASTPPPAPTLTVTSVNGTQTISFATVANATYTLHYTNADGLTSPIHTWPTVGTNISGNGSVESFTQTATDSERFYSVSAH